MQGSGSKIQRTQAPDGGWGWIVVLGVSLINLAERSIEPSFGLLFGDILSDLSIATTGAGIIVSAYEAVFNFSGLFIGPLIKTYSYRKVTFFGALLSGVGLILTYPAASMTHILCTYSIVNGFGVGVSSSATFVALNHYFKKKRGLAVGLTMTGTGVGLLLMPQAIRYLTEEYDFAGSMLIVGAFALNACVGSLILQPVKWHLKKVKAEEGNLLLSRGREENGNCPHITITQVITEKNEEEADEEPESDVIQTNGISKENVAVLEKNRPLALKRQFSAIMRHNSLFDSADSARTYQADFEASKNILNKSSTETKLDKYFQENNKARAPGRRKLSETSYHSNKNTPMQVPSTISLHKSVVEANMAQNSFPTVRKRKGSTLSNLSNLDFTGSCLQIHAINHEVQDDIKSITSQKSQKLEDRGDKSVFSRFAHLLDLDLLKDPIFVNILFGLSIFYVAELNFKMIVPFFLAHLGHSKSETAFCLSMMAASDIVARVILPPICDRLTGVITRRTMFMIATIFCAVSRSALAESGEWIQLETILIISGFFRGATLINFMLVVAEYCDDKLEKLPAAFGLHMVAKGLFIVIFGPLISFIRDATGSYQICIHAQSVCIFLCAVAWNIETLLLFVKRTVKKPSLIGGEKIDNKVNPPGN